MRNNKRDAKALKVYYGDNFKPEGVKLLVDLDTKGAYLDERHMFLVTNLDMSNFDWYYNYLDFVRSCSEKNPTAYPSYMLDLGYVPVVFLPTCCSELETPLRRILDARKIPYISKYPMSFTIRRLTVDGTDSWVSKIDAAKFLNIRPEEVRSVDIVRRLLS